MIPIWLVIAIYLVMMLLVGWVCYASGKSRGLEEALDRRLDRCERRLANAGNDAPP